MALWLQDMYLWLGFNPKAAQWLIREHGQDSPDSLQVLINKSVDNNCNIVRKPGGKNANGMPQIGPSVLVIAQENPKLATFLFHHRWMCTFDWEVTGVWEDTVHLLVGQKRLKDD